MSIKLIALDVDGTLVDNTHVNISERNISALRKCRSQGIIITLVSGRALSLMNDVAEKLECVSYIISANGGIIYDCKKKEIIDKNVIPVESAAEILHIISRYDVPLEVYSDGDMYTDASKWKFDGYDKQPKSFIEARKKVNILTDDIEKALHGRTVEKFNIDNLKRKDALKILDEIKQFRDTLSVNYIDIYDNLEISDLRANKGYALEHLCNRLQIKAEDVMAFGDSDNDETMLTWAGESYAMANGVQIAKRAAKHETLSNEEDGVAYAIEKDIL